MKVGIIEWGLLDEQLEQGVVGRALDVKGDVGSKTT
jgi:hypothetical protein